MVIYNHENDGYRSHESYSLFGINGTEVSYTVQKGHIYTLFQNQGDIINQLDEQIFWTTDTINFHGLRTYHSYLNANPQLLFERWNSTNESSPYYVVFKLGNGQTLTRGNV